VLLLGFSAEVVRVRVVVGRSVPCGCFGGRDAIDVGAVLARNAGFAVLGVVALVGAEDAPVLRWPGAPGPGEILPMMLASAGSVVAVFAAWQARVWLGRKT
jgi:hypothetical protein